MRLRVRLSLLTLSVLLVSQSLLQAAEGPDLIPQSAAAVIRLQAPKTTIKEAAGFVDDVQPGFGQLVSGQAGMLGVGISNPTLQGVDQSRDWYAAVFLSEEEDPAVVYVIPALDVKAMESAIAEDFDFVAQDDYGIYSDNAGAMEIFRKHLDGPRSKSVASLASDSLKTFMGASHISVAVNLVLVKEIYATELGEMREKFLEGVQEAQAEMPEVPGMKLEWVAEMMDKLVEKLEVATEDSQSYAVALTLAKSGIRLEDLLEFADGSRSSKFLAKYPAESLTIINKLPAEQIGYGSYGKSLMELSTWGITILPKMLELNDEQTAGLEEAKKLMSELKFGDSASSFSLGDMETGLLRAVSIAEVSPTDKFRMTTEKMATVMNGVEFPGMKQEMTLEKNHEKIDGVDVDLLVTKQVLEDEAELGGLQAQMNVMLYGAEGPEARIAYVADGYIQTVGGGSDFMKAALAAYNSSTAAGDTVLARDLKPLGATNNIVGLFDVQTLIVQGLKIAVASPNLPPMPFDQETLKDLNVKRAYIGVSMTTLDNGNGISGKLHIPKETLQAGFQLFAFFQQMQSKREDF